MKSTKKLFIVEKTKEIKVRYHQGVWAKDADEAYAIMDDALSDPYWEHWATTEKEYISDVEHEINPFTELPYEEEFEHAE